MSYLDPLRMPILVHHGWASSRGEFYILLRSDGFSGLLEKTAKRAQEEATNSRSKLAIALTLDGHIPMAVGRGALTEADRFLVDAILEDRAELVSAATPRGPRLLLDRTGRTRFVGDDTPTPTGAAVIGSLRSGDGLDPGILARYDEHQARGRALRTRLQEWLARQPGDCVRKSLDHLSHALLHMAPVLVYVDDRHYSNLGKFSNLPGKSMRAGDPRNLLKQLAAIPVTEWSATDATFVALSTLLLRSGTQARLEEANGTELTPEWLEDFLTVRLRSYGVDSVRHTEPDLGPRLEKMARCCAEKRRELLHGGTVFYRLIHGVNLNKIERLLREPITYADVPAGLRAFLADRAAIPPETAGIGGTAPALTRLAAALDAATAPARFTTAFEGFLTAFMTALAEAARSDVAMGRGPRSIAALRRGRADDPLLLSTNDFYCCVAPSAAFAARFAGDRGALAKTLSAYSARMRFNSWHYLPHVLGITGREPGRDDWFFAPTMPDLTHWSDRHHTGHVAFGVRFAIRVPFGIDVEGRHLPGLYDLRLMRAEGPAYETKDLRGAIAAGRVLALLYQAMSRHDVVVRDFGNGWFRSFYG